MVQCASFSDVLQGEISDIPVKNNTKGIILYNFDSSTVHGMRLGNTVLGVTNLLEIHVLLRLYIYWVVSLIYPFSTKMLPLPP